MQTSSGRPTARSTGVHRRSSVDRNGRLTGMSNFLLGSVDRPVGRKDGSVGRLDQPTGESASPAWIRT